MNEHEQPESEELQEAWIESLLASVPGPPDHRDRVARAMSQIEPAQVAPRPAGPARERTRFVRWASVGSAVAAMVALVLLVQYSGTRSAEAAILRSLDVASQQTTRKYRLQVEHQNTTGRTHTIDNDLYVQGNERLALRHPGPLPGTSTWLGRNGPESWVVPPFGPVLKGDKMMLNQWIRSHEDMDTPYLHVTTMLTRMSRGYRLKKLSDEEVVVPVRGPIACQHVLAERKSPDDPDRPDTIELWASRESGVAVRVVARWELSVGDSGRKSVVLTFQGEEPSLAEGWFNAEAHCEGDRPVVRMENSDE